MAEYYLWSFYEAQWKWDIPPSVVTLIYNIVDQWLVCLSLVAAILLQKSGHIFCQYSLRNAERVLILSSGPTESYQANLTLI